jgi:CPA1 family monovalent cation:H+ antiporter
MLIFEWTLVLLVAAVALTALARRWHAPYPSLLAVLGCALVFLPGAPHFVLEPELALALFVAPVLLDAAYDTSPRDLRDNWVPIAGLVLVAVGATTAAVAVVARWLVPDLPWAAAIALGAIVAPPDAAAATAVLRSAPLPHRVLQILEGESLLNDATALLTYRVAVGAAMGASVSVGHTAPLLLGVAVGSLVAGAALAWVGWRLLRFTEDVPSAIVLQFAGTFAVWIAAERVGLSGILTVVAYAIGIARVAPMSTPARVRVPAYAVWETAVFVLNALAFVLIGLQLGPILERLSPAERHAYAIVALAVLATVIVARIVWVMPYNWAVRWKIRRFGSSARRPLMQPSVGSGVIISWCGMRGIVTLAAALALPDGAQPFPFRDLILVTAFTVVLGTLVVQGLTVRPLLLWLDLRDDAPVEREARLARQAALKAALKSLHGNESLEAQTLRGEYKQLWSANGAERADDDGRDALPRLRRDTVVAARRQLASLRDDGTIGDDAFHRVEKELDRAELYAEGSGR